MKFKAFPGSIFVLLLIVSCAFGAENADLNDLQGKWECKKTLDGQNVTLTLEIKSDKLTFRMEGAISIVATGDLKVERLGPFKSFTSRNIKAGTSEDGLQEIEGEMAHVYTLEGDLLYITSNFDKQRDRAPGMDIYRKAAAPSKK